ncbi:DUF6541 family protein [Paratractidigestivibacter sp.]|uniref:DUF6541 family protein n=1 Tax=Paratractidigestivibacter sp. TaxID=2847316 RepID=UPI002AC990C3|nr:DUF6541 family protein [Paratractidigestivibacter sp.]
MTWLLFASCLLLGISLLIAPGFLIGRIFGADRAFSAAFAPVASTALYAVLSVAYGFFGVPCALLSLVLVPMAFLLALRLALIRSGARICEPLSLHECFANKPLGHPHLSWTGLCIIGSFAFSLFLTVVFYLSPLGSPDELLPIYDNAFHLTRLRAFVESANYSSLSGGFYPSAWHCFSALIMSTTGCVTTIAAQASALSFVLCAFPLGMFCFLATLFPDKPRRVLLGSLFCLCAWFFPWKILISGPLYPNLASFALMPASLAVFLRLFSKNAGTRDRVVCVAMFISACAALVLSQPNALFFSAIFTIPFLMREVRKSVSGAIKNKASVPVGIFCEFLFLVLCVVAWVAVMRLPFMQSLVSYEQEKRFTLAQALPKLLTFQFIIWRPQYLLFVALFIGAVRVLTEGESRWLTFSYAAVAIVYLASVAMDGALRGYISGFCYNDCSRTASCVCIVAVPLVAAGLDTALTLVTRGLQRMSVYLPKAVCHRAALILQAVCLVLFAGFNYFPLFDIPRFASWGFDTIAWETHDCATNKKIKFYTNKESNFVKKAKEIVGDSLVINQPYDGSVFSYAMDGLNVVFPRFGFLSEGSDESYLMANLCNIASDASVRDAVDRLGIKYVLLLDQGDRNDAGLNLQGTFYTLGYNSDEWTGVDTIRDDTPGFKSLLCDGDMRLYEIEL